MEVSRSFIWDVAYVSGMLRFFNDVVGGIYTFIILILELFGRMSLVCMPYSLLLVDSIWIGFLTYVASPPRVLSWRRDSINVNPSIVGAVAPSAIHVSCKHRTSIFCYSSISRSLRWLNPYIFRLPIYMPFSHHCFSVFLFVLCFLLEPFVRSFLYCMYLLLRFRYV